MSRRPSPTPSSCGDRPPPAGARLARLAPLLLVVAGGTLAVWLLASMRCEQLRGGGSWGGGGGGGTMAAAASAAPACKVDTKYFPSVLEQQWLDNVREWEKDFCRFANTTEQREKGDEWTRVLMGEQAGPRFSAQGVPFDPALFSRFVTTTECRGRRQQQQVSWIEPLAFGLRAPAAFCRYVEMPYIDLYTIDYLHMAYAFDVNRLRQSARQRCRGRDCQSIMFDLGATTWEDTRTFGHQWFYHQYERHGISFDRMLLWEAKVYTPEEIYRNLPRELLHKYQYFNIPAPTDMSDASHPVRMLKEVAQPGDFVVFKLDIDQWAVEREVLNALLADEEALALVDEFFFEYHVQFGPMLHFWRETAEPHKTLADAYELFLDLRKRGVRAHSWV